MNVAATQVTIAIENVRLLRSLRRYAAQQREAVRDAEAARAEAESASRTKDEFLAMLGHELRNPLAPDPDRPSADATAGRRDPRDARTDGHRAAGRAPDSTGRRPARCGADRPRQGPARMERLHVADVIAKAVEIASPLIEQRRHTLDVQVPGAI